MRRQNPQWPTLQGICNANGRSRKHGGISTGAPKGNQNARKHGIYSDKLPADEQGMWDEIDVGTLDDDIKIAKLQLRRALLAQAKTEVGDDQAWRDPRAVQQAAAASSVFRATFSNAPNRGAQS